MNINKVHVILYVADQARSRDFYAAVLGRPPVLDVAGMTEFAITDRFTLGLMPESGIAKILSDKTPHPGSANGVPRCELYIYTDQIDAAFTRAVKAGAKEISPIATRDWGDTAGYLTDPDGHVLVFATVGA